MHHIAPAGFRGGADPASAKTPWPLKFGNVSLAGVQIAKTAEEAVEYF